MPAQSSRRCCGSRDSSRRPPPNEAATAMGTCTRNTLCQLDGATMPAPMIGPRPRPMPKTTPQAPKAWRARRCRRTGATAPPAGRPAWRAGYALKEAARDQPGGTACQAAGRGGEAEQHQAEQECPFAPVAVGQRARRHQHGGAGDGVAFMIHCRSRKLLRRTVSRMGRITGTLEISRPNIRQARQAAVSVTVFLCAGVRGFMGVSTIGRILPARRVVRTSGRTRSADARRTVGGSAIVEKTKMMEMI